MALGVEAVSLAGQDGVQPLEAMSVVARAPPSHRASVMEPLRSRQDKIPQREACLAGGYSATRLADGKSVRSKRVK